MADRETLRDLREQQANLAARLEENKEKNNAGAVKVLQKKLEHVNRRIQALMGDEGDEGDEGGDDEPFVGDVDFGEDWAFIEEFEWDSIMEQANEGLDTIPEDLQRVLGIGPVRDEVAETLAAMRRENPKVLALIGSFQPVDLLNFGAQGFVLENGRLDSEYISKDMNPMSDHSVASTLNREIFHSVDTQSPRFSIRTREYGGQTFQVLWEEDPKGIVNTLDLEKTFGETRTPDFRNAAFDALRSLREDFRSGDLNLEERVEEFSRNFTPKQIRAFSQLVGHQALSFRPSDTSSDFKDLVLMRLLSEVGARTVDADHWRHLRDSVSEYLEDLVQELQRALHDYGSGNVEARAKAEKLFDDWFPGFDLEAQRKKIMQRVGGMAHLLRHSGIRVEGLNVLFEQLVSSVDELDEPREARILELSGVASPTSVDVEEDDSTDEETDDGLGELYDDDSAELPFGRLEEVEELEDDMEEPEEDVEPTEELDSAALAEQPEPPEKWKTVNYLRGKVRAAVEAVRSRRQKKAKTEKAPAGPKRPAYLNETIPGTVFYLKHFLTDQEGRTLVEDTLRCLPFDLSEVRNAQGEPFSAEEKEAIGRLMPELLAHFFEKSRDIDRVETDGPLSALVDSVLFSEKSGKPFVQHVLKKDGAEKAAAIQTLLKQMLGRANEVNEQLAGLLGQLRFSSADEALFKQLVQPLEQALQHPSFDDKEVIQAMARSLDAPAKRAGQAFKRSFDQRQKSEVIYQQAKAVWESQNTGENRLVLQGAQAQFAQAQARFIQAAMEHARYTALTRVLHRASEAHGLDLSTVFTDLFDEMILARLYEDALPLLGYEGVVALKDLRDPLLSALKQHPSYRGQLRSFSVGPDGLSLAQDAHKALPVVRGGQAMKRIQKDIIGGAALDVLNQSEQAAYLSERWRGYEGNQKESKRLIGVEEVLGVISEIQPDEGLSRDVRRFMAWQLMGTFGLSKETYDKKKGALVEAAEIFEAMHKRGIRLDVQHGDSLVSTLATHGINGAVQVGFNIAGSVPFVGLPFRLLKPVAELAVTGMIEAGWGVGQARWMYERAEKMGLSEKDLDEVWDYTVSLQQNEWIITMTGNLVPGRAGDAIGFMGDALVKSNKRLLAHPAFTKRLGNLLGSAYVSGVSERDLDSATRDTFRKIDGHASQKGSVASLAQGISLFKTKNPFISDAVGKWVKQVEEDPTAIQKTPILGGLIKRVFGKDLSFMKEEHKPLDLMADVKAALGAQYASAEEAFNQAVADGKLSLSEARDARRGGISAQIRATQEAEQRYREEIRYDLVDALEFLRKKDDPARPLYLEMFRNLIDAGVLEVKGAKGKREIKIVETPRHFEQVRDALRRVEAQLYVGGLPSNVDDEEEE